LLAINLYDDVNQLDGVSCIAGALGITVLTFAVTVTAEALPNK
jgi:hypothetical protein